MYTPTLPVYSYSDAIDLGFEPITSAVSPKYEPEIVKSMELSMRGVNACWLKSPTYRFRDGLELCRMKNQILK
jgi:hypothetical protein